MAWKVRGKIAAVSIAHIQELDVVVQMSGLCGLGSRDLRLAA